MNRLGLSYADFFQSLNTHRTEEYIPINSGIVLLQFLVRHLMIVGFGITLLHGRIRRNGNTGFNAHHGFHLTFGFFRSRAAQGEHLLHICLERFTDMHRGRIIVQIILFLTEAQTALPDLKEVHATVLDVGINVEAEVTGKPLATEFSHLGYDFLAVLDGCNSLQVSLDRGITLLVLLHAVHGNVIQITDFLLQGTGFVLSFGHGFYQVAQLFVIVLNQDLKVPVSRVLAREWMSLDPTAAGILIEIISRLRLLVQITQFDSRLGNRSATARQCQRSKGQHREKLL